MLFSNPLHLYRALLRQCTYLPDPAARSYMQLHVKARYRNTLGVLGSKRGKDLKKKAQKALSLLLRANAGHLNPLERILLLTYGRIGKRRHEFMRFLREPDVPMDDKALAELSLKELEKKPGLTDKMRVLIKSQKAVKYALHGDLPKQQNPQPNIPELNSWGRPMPQARIRNLEREWFADVLESLITPLPEPEWDRLRDLAVGRLKWEGLLPRRTIATGVSEDATLQYVQSKYENSKETHKLTARLMQRLWGRIFQKCPVMRWNEESMQWQVQWGVSELTEANMRGPNHVTDLSMFAGVDSRGKVLQEANSLQSCSGDDARDIMEQLQTV